jgi:hypothetical protein
MGGLVVFAAALFAHHGQAAYNTKEPVTVSGTVSEFQFTNPHVLVTLEVKAGSGGIEKWQGELTSPNHLLRAGWTKTSVKVGDRVTMTGWQAASGAKSLWLSKIVVNDEEMKLGQGN